ncbi:MAG: hypothetical protein F6K50_09080 [Moorea sp. SIO3I7]|nr:hypothetical protein [Moorena sp. SIO3I7]NEO04771.1 hypothetical protein [Moorena sp. SIO3I8]NEO45603.1 hypothetical protein [Moorena sp. SIO4A3]NEP21014.1 hypothetical protein [Moorena sp. SIO3I6]NEQ81869.1 hypothetical protein [Moorena sp. SIO2I5]
MQLGKILVRKRLISPIQLNTALEIQSLTGIKLGEILVTKELIESQDLEQALLEQYWRKNGFWVID